MDLGGHNIFIKFITRAHK